MKVIVNITSWVGISGNAIHYYAKIIKDQDLQNIYLYAENEDWPLPDEDLSRMIDHKEAEKLNKKDGRGSKWKSGMSTIRFNSEEDIIELVKETYPNDDIIILHEKELDLDTDLIVRSIYPVKFTGDKLRIIDFKGFSPNFANCTADSIHSIIEPPEQYKHKELQPGCWINGVYEPMLVLKHEYEIIKD